MRGKAIFTTSFGEHTLQNGERTTTGPIHRLDLPDAQFAEAFKPDVPATPDSGRMAATGSFARLVSCHIANFGKLHDQDYAFEPGLNVIEAANGVGKTTLANFVRAMFYGFDDEAVQEQGREDLRERYRPWQGGTYGGEMTFEGAGGTYKVERAFADDARGDFLAVYNMENGERARELEGDLGGRLFGMDADSFERSTYVARLSGPHTRPTQRMLAKLSGVPAAQGLPSPSASDQVAERHAQLCQRSREYADELARIEAFFGKEPPSNVAADELKAALDEIDRAAGEDASQAQELQAVRDFVARSAERFSEGLPTEEEIASYQDMQTQLVQTRAREGSGGLTPAEEEQLAELERRFAQGTPTPDELAHCQELISQLAQASGALRNARPTEQELQRLMTLQGYFQAGVPTDVEIQRCRGLIASAQTMRGLDTAQLDAVEGKGSVAASVLGGVGLVLLAVGLIVAVVLYLPEAGIVLAAIGACACVVALLLAVAGKSGSARHTSEAATQAELKAQGLERQAEAFTSQYARNVEPVKAIATIERLRSELSALSERVDRANAQVGRLEEEAAPLREEVAAFLAGYGQEQADLQQGLVALQAQVEALARLTQAREQAKEQEQARAARAQGLEARLTSFLSRYYPDVNPANAASLLANLAGTVSAYGQAQRMLAASSSSAEGRQERAEAAQRRLAQVCERYGWPAAKVGRDFAENLAGAAARYPVVQAKLDAVRAQLRELVATYGPPPYGPISQAASDAVEESFASYIERFSGIAASGVAVDENSGAVIRQQGRTHQIAELSQGYSDVIAFCMRMALGDALFEGAKPFIILDDPFVNLDDRHMAEALSFIQDLSRDRQLIYLTCHSSRSL